MEPDMGPNSGHSAVMMGSAAEPLVVSVCSVRMRLLPPSASHS